MTTVRFIGTTIIGLVAAIMIISCGKQTEPTPLENRNFEFTSWVDFSSLPADADSVEIWLPIPSSREYQKITDKWIEGAAPEIVTDPNYGNRMIHFKGAVKDLAGQRIAFLQEVDRTEACSSDDNSLAATVGDTTLLARYLQPDSLVPIDGKIAAEAMETTKGITGREKQAKALYDHLVKTMAYDKSGEGWGRGDAIYACDIRKGNCTDFHSLFIGMARSLGIPARFKMGYSIPADAKAGDIAGYHCWAEFFVDGKGWIPVDISEANKHPEQAEYLFGNLDPNRVDISIGRDITLPATDNKRVNYLNYAIAKVDTAWVYNLTRGVSFADVSE